MKARTTRRLLALHAWLGLALAAVLMIVAGSGALLAFRIDLERTLGPRVEWDGEPMASWEAIRDAARAMRPDARLQMIWFPSPARPYFTVAYAVGDREYTDAILVHPATGQRLAEQPGGSGWLDRVEALHENLGLGEFGSTLVGWCGPLLLVLIGSGTALAWSGRRHSPLFVIRRGRRLPIDLHRAVGLLAAPCAIVMIWTAAVWTFPGLEGCVHFLLGEPRPELPHGELWRLESVVPEAMSNLAQDVQLASGASLITRAREECSGPGRPDFLSFPLHPTESRQVRIRLGQGSDGVAPACTAYFDRYSGALLGIADPGRGPASRYLRDWNDRLHVGALGGVVGRVIWGGSSLGLSIVALTGIWLRWRRLTVSGCGRERPPGVE